MKTIHVDIFWQENTNGNRDSFLPSYLTLSFLRRRAVRDRRQARQVEGLAHAQQDRGHQHQGRPRGHLDRLEVKQPLSKHGDEEAVVLDGTVVLARESDYLELCSWSRFSSLLLKQ